MEPVLEERPEVSTKEIKKGLVAAQSKVSIYVDAREIEVKECVEKYGNLVPDTSTPEGYEQCKQIRRELLPLKMELEQDRKTLKAPLTAAGKSLDANMKPLVSQIEELYKPHEEAYRKKDREVEEAKLQREADVNAAFKALGDALVSAVGEKSETILLIASELELLEINEETFEARFDEANARKNAALAKLKDMFSQAEQQESFAKKQAELEAREADIAAKEKAEADRIAAEKRKEEQAKRDEQLRKEEAEKAEADRVAAEKRHAEELKLRDVRAKEQAEQAAADERQRIIRETNEAEQAKRDADRKAIEEDERKAKSRKHRATINSQIVIALQQGAELSQEQAKKVVELAAKGLAGALTVKY